MGFRGSRVQIPPSRLIQVKAPSAFTLMVLFLSPPAWASFRRVSMLLLSRALIQLVLRSGLRTAAHEFEAFSGNLLRS